MTKEECIKLADFVDKNIGCSYHIGGKYEKIIIYPKQYIPASILKRLIEFANEYPEIYITGVNDLTIKFGE